MLKSWCSVLLISIISGAVSTAMGGQPLETESARLAARGTLKVEAGLERQTSADGSEANLPAALEYSPADRVEILVEPVVYTRIRDPHRTLASGPGDFEVTALMLARTEARWAPAVAFAAEVKIPTARSRFIGSGKPDYTVYSIASKQWGVWDTHLNLAYAWIGRPPGVRIQNVYGFAVAVERRLRRFDVVAEVLGNTAALAEGQAAEGGESTVAPEVGGEELVATVGGRFHVSDQVTLSLGGSYDNQRAVQIHPGITLRWR